MGEQLHMQKNGCMIGFQRLWLAGCTLPWRLWQVECLRGLSCLRDGRYRSLSVILSDLDYSPQSTSIFLSFYVIMTLIYWDDFVLSFKMISFFFFFLQNFLFLNSRSSLIIIQIWGNMRLYFFFHLNYKLNFQSFISVLKSGFCL